MLAASITIKVSVSSAFLVYFIAFFFVDEYDTDIKTLGFGVTAIDFYPELCPDYDILLIPVSILLAL